MLFGGGKGGGKSLLFCLWVYFWSQHLIDLFEIKDIGSPLPVGFIGRKQGVDFRRTTLETFKRTIPSHYYTIKEQDQEIVIQNKVKIYFGGLDDRQRINKFNSAEFAFIGIDQAEETERTDVDVLQGALRLKFNGKTPPYKQLYTANPADCWLKEDFIDNRLPSYYFIPALYSDNPHLPDSYADTLTNAFKYNKALLSAYLKGDWHALQAENALLSSKQLEDLRGVNKHFKEIRRVVSCDPSLGGDECVIHVIENYNLLEQVILHTRDTMKIAGEMVSLANRYKCNNYCADVTGGLGQGILDRIREIKPTGNLFYLNYSSREDSYVNGVNLKAEMCWKFMENVLNFNVPYIYDEELRKQILALRFKVVDSHGHIIMEPKAKVKERIGRSPDRADAFIMGCFVLNRTDPIIDKDGWRDDYKKSDLSYKKISAMAA